jgi:hypothetical protein
MAVYQEWDKHTEIIKARFQFSKTYIWKITFHTVSFEASFVCMDCLMFMNFVALIIYCVKHTLLPVFLFNEAVSFLNYPD